MQEKTCRICLNLVYLLSMMITSFIHHSHGYNKPSHLGYLDYYFYYHFSIIFVFIDRLQLYPILIIMT